MSTRVETGRKRVRALAGGRIVADTRRPVLVWEKPYYPTYYLPREDVFAELVPTGEVSRSPSRGNGVVNDVVLKDRTLPSAAVTIPDSPLPELRGLVRLDWDSMDEWLEEDEPVYVHPRDPYKRVDILNSSKHVVVSVDGIVVADSHQPRILFETSLPPRYYLPLTDVRFELLRPTTLVTHCPYKGAATYYDVVLESGSVHSNIVWTYRTPLPESQKVAGLLAFYDEKVDVSVDGVAQARPVTHF